MLGLSPLVDAQLAGTRAENTQSHGAVFSGLPNRFRLSTPTDPSAEGGRGVMVASRRREGGRSPPTRLNSPMFHGNS